MTTNETRNKLEELEKWAQEKYEYVQKRNMSDAGWWEGYYRAVRDVNALVESESSSEPKCRACDGSGFVTWIESEPESGTTTHERAICDTCYGTGYSLLPKGQKNDD